MVKADAHPARPTTGKGFLKQIRSDDFGAALAMSDEVNERQALIELQSRQLNRVRSMLPSRAALATIEQQEAELRGELAALDVSGTASS